MAAWRISTAGSNRDCCNAILPALQLSGANCNAWKRPSILNTSSGVWEALTPEKYRRQRKLQKLPSRYTIPTESLPVSAGRVTFIRQVTPHGNVHLLGQTYKIGKRMKGQYVKAVLDTKRAHLTVYVKGRIFKRWSYPFLHK